MRKTVAILLFCALCLQLRAEDPYTKFRSSKDLEERSSFATIFRQKDKLLLEIPDSLLGRRVLLNSRVRTSSTPSIPVGTDISASEAYRIAATDSLVLFLQPAGAFFADDISVSESMKNARTDAIVMALPIKYRNADSTAFVVEADKLLDPSRKVVADLKGRQYGDNSISSSTFKKDFCIVKDITAYPGSVGVLRTLTFDLKLGGIFGELVGTWKFTGDVETCLTLLSDSSLQPLKADERIGVRTVSRPSFEASSQGFRNRRLASRWNLSGDRRICVYIDTLLARPWRDAVTEGLLEWNRAFEAAGLGSRVCAEPFPAQGFNSCNPLVSTVIQGTGSSVGASLTTDPQTGEILSFCMTIPDDFVYTARREGMVFISDVDTRFQRYDVPEDAVAEALKAKVMSVFGLCLGLVRNMAGSYAYSPGQLRDPSFTAEHGITASVTDDVLFNLLARPGDREKGVATVVSRLGAYDIYAICWLYDESLDRDEWLESHHGDAEYLFLPQVRSSDPRGISQDLGNDPFRTCDTVLERLEWVAENAPSWIDREEVGDDYKMLFADYIFLGVNRMAFVMSSQVGGLMADNRSTPKYTAVPSDRQKEAIGRIIDCWNAFTWLDDKRELLSLAGANSNVSSMARMYAWTQSGLDRRLGYLAMSEELVPGSYTLAEALRDIEDALLADVRAGKPLAPGTEVAIQQYAVSLRGRSPMLQVNYDKANHKAFALDITRVPPEYTRDSEAVCYNALIHLRKSLESAALRRRGAEKARLQFVISEIDNSLSQ